MVHRTSCDSIYFDTDVSQGELCLTSICVSFRFSTSFVFDFPYVCLTFRFIGSWFLFGKLYQGQRDIGLTVAAFIRILVETNERAMREKTVSGKGWELGKKEYSTGFRPDRD